METIRQEEFSLIIVSELPEVKNDVVSLCRKGNIAGVMQIVVNYMRDMVRGKQLDKVLRCMNLVGWMYGRGDSAVREIIANVFVRSFNGLHNQCTNWEWERIREDMPANLYSVYTVQNRALMGRV
ncbi:DUF7674 family protein [Parapedobacter koreensis]|uniref:DUF7674 domain-containing protein n=1 Tax=Parapedobacter koreensis TaxID=332977 RepID=A0A1H7MG89_9SPHI|nr:hypothetical protein [Parapedobacter koreensis]SEL10089.1 hypothetical protein SAMN05421740_103499 [Parapedobacter koreensis]